MDNPQRRSTDGATVIGAERSNRTMACTDRPRQQTVLENINESIESHNRSIAKLMKLRDETPGSVLGLPVEKLRALGWPDQHPF